MPSYLGVMAQYAARAADIKQILNQWLPAGLSISFVAATLVVVFGD